MSKSSNTLYGNVPDKSPVALLLIDVINDLDFPDSKSLLRHALPMAHNLSILKTRAKKHGQAVIYVNDNFGRWRSDFKSQIQHCLTTKSRGKPIVELLHPDEDDYFVLKPAHSGFFSTTLEILLKHLEAKILVITGMATDICVLFTANDAYLRGYDVHIPKDCVAANSAKLTSDALQQMKSTLKAGISNSDSLPWKKWIGKNKK